MNNLFARILILAPTGKDAQLSKDILKEADISSVSIVDMVDLCCQIEAGAGAIILTEESVEEDRSRQLLNTLEAQPAWSDIPILVMTKGGADSHAAVQALEKLGYVILLERPVRINTLISAARAALRARQRQLVLRDKGEQLMAQADKLYRSNRELEQFAYISSHDLQEPLRKISTFSELLRNSYQKQLDENCNRFLEIISNSARHMSQLIQDLLSYARLTKTEEVIEPTDFNDVVENVLNDLELSIKELKAVVTVDPLPIVPAEKARFHHVFLNLLSNALKFHGEAAPRIHISSKIKDGWAEISIKDNGIGIEREYLDKIFNIFQRLHNKTKYPGTGIGLAICQKVIERHGGKIWAESIQGQGTTFRFSIPLKKSAGTVEGPAEELQSSLS